MTKKRRVNVYINGENFDRLKQIVSEVPGMTASGVIDELLEDFMPAMEMLVEAAKSGDRDVQAKMLSSLLADQFISLAAGGVDAVRHTLNADDAGKEKST